MALILRVARRVFDRVAALFDVMAETLDSVAARRPGHHRDQQRQTNGFAENTVKSLHGFVSLLVAIELTTMSIASLRLVEHQINVQRSRQCQP
jgi:hypothetical protein